MDNQQRIQELTAERDAASAHATAMFEQMQEADQQIEDWIEGFDMVQDEDGDWCWRDGLQQELEKLYELYMALRRDWNRFVPRYNSRVAPTMRNFGAR